MNREVLGKLWAKWLVTWAQMSSAISLMQFLAVLGTFFTTTASRYVPLWVYFAVLAAVIVPGLIFVSKVGVGSYFSYWNEKTRLSGVEKKVDQCLENQERIMKHLGISKGDGK